MARSVLLFVFLFFVLSPLAFSAIQISDANIVNYKSGYASKLALEAGKLPSPTGSYKIGTFIIHMTDTSRKDIWGDKPDRFREISMQVWYPTQVSKEQKTVPYFPDARLIDAMRKDGFYDQKPEVIDGWKDVSTHSVLNAQIIKSPHKLPLILFSHGLGMPRSHYTSFIEDLASHGYIVAAIDHPHGRMMILPDGQIIPGTVGDTPEGAAEQASAWAEDASFVLDQMTNLKNKSASRFAN